MTVKNQADINNLTVLTGYLVDGNIHVPLADSNRHYKMVQEWIAEGNTPEAAYTQKEIDDNSIEMTYQELMKRLDILEIEFRGHTFSGNAEAQAYMVSMLTKIEGDNPNATRDVYAIDGRTKVPMTKSNMLDFMIEVDIVQEAITGV